MAGGDNGQNLLEGTQKTVEIFWCLDGLREKRGNRVTLQRKWANIEIFWKRGG